MFIIYMYSNKIALSSRISPSGTMNRAAGQPAIVFLNLCVEFMGLFKKSPLAIFCS